MSDDRYTVVSKQSWFSRLSGSLKAVGLGVLIFLAAWPLLWWNEGRAVLTAKSLAEGAGIVVSVSANWIDPANEGRLVHVSGRAETDDTLTDPDFPAASVTALRLDRKVEIFQWMEHQETTEKKNMGGSVERQTTYTYSRDWSSSRIDSSRFHQPSGHENPSSLPYEPFSLTATDVTIGAFTMPRSLTDKLPASDTVRLEGMESKNTTRPRVVRGQYYIGANPDEPAVGDMRIRHTYAPQQDVSIIARQQGNSFGGYQTSDGRRTLLMLKPGLHDASSMFSAAQSANSTLTWLLRAIGFILMLAGLRMIFGIVGVLGDVVPFIGDVLRLGTGLISLAIALACSLLVIAMAWIFYRPVLGLALLTAAVAVFAGVIMKARKHPQTA
ncbi:MAG: hypothetical protein EOM25_05435 [Deltaproteobacteria bacterium]|nr:hypothetical protein [Deltaproteobacteria bacterium]